MEIKREKRTQKQIKDEIKSLEAQIDDIQNIRKYKPELIELENKIRAIKNSYYEEIKTSVECWKSDIKALNLELIRKKEENELQISERVQKWLDKYLSGVYFGYKEPRIVWISEDEKFVIITSSGGTAGTGTAMGTGGYYYAASTHWLADTTSSIRYVGDFGKCNRWMEHEGRLTKDVKQKMIDYTEELRKQK